MWILITAGLALIGTVCGSLIAVFDAVKHLEGLDKWLRFAWLIAIQLVIDAVIVGLAIYFMIELDAANEIRDNTQSTPDFFRAMFKGIGYVVGLGFLWYGYVQQLNILKENAEIDRLID